MKGFLKKCSLVKGRGMAGWVMGNLFQECWQHKQCWNWEAAWSNGCGKVSLSCCTPDSFCDDGQVIVCLIETSSYYCLRGWSVILSGIAVNASEWIEWKGDFWAALTFSSNIISIDNIISLDRLINKLIIVCPHFAGHLDFRHSCINVCSDDAWSDLWRKFWPF